MGIMRRKPAGVRPTSIGAAMVTAKSHKCTSVGGGKVLFIVKFSNSNAWAF
jgi:hypothetical protein